MRHALSAVLGLACVASSAANAAETPVRAICAVEQVIYCPPFDECERSLPGAVNLPTLLRIDRPAGVVLSRWDSGGEQTSKIASEAGDAEFHVLQGIDDGSPWSIRIDLGTGRFVLTSAQLEAGFIGFGLCSARILE